ncbi:hypothetical protein M8C21_025185 [Ambrosia artemisiifolia]|uniref:Uncharacterized protein n=1 Tax=Ambrosia artemisiifolia TaxID=4212 RepID=A0AAD5G3V4_AMBAR|nr:hypothetical protein M8C21_025185 [Ambrosia artemisiifolia]
MLNSTCNCRAIMVIVMDLLKPRDRNRGRYYKLKLESTLTQKQDLYKHNFDAYTLACIRGAPFVSASTYVDIRGVGNIYGITNHHIQGIHSDIYNGRAITKIILQILKLANFQDSQICILDSTCWSFGFYSKAYSTFTSLSH